MKAKDEEQKIPTVYSDDSDRNKEQEEDNSKKNKNISKSWKELEVREFLDPENL